MNLDYISCCALIVGSCSVMSVTLLRVSLRCYGVYLSCNRGLHWPVSALLFAVP